MSNKDSYNEVELLPLIAAGDQQAFEFLYRYYWNELYPLALAFLKSPSQAEDTLQEVFVKLWLKRNTLTELRAFKQYFMAMVRNEIINTLRKKSGQIIIPHTDEIIVVDETNPDHFINRKEAAQLILKALASLPRKQQEIFKLSREEGLLHEDIAAKMNVSKKTISNTITIVLNHIRNVLDREGYLLNIVGAGLLGRLFF